MRKKHLFFLKALSTFLFFMQYRKYNLTFLFAQVLFQLAARLYRKQSKSTTLFGKKLTKVLSSSISSDDTKKRREKG